MYDIADLYKAEISIPVAFQTAAEKPTDIGAETRRKMRDAVFDLSILPRMVSDIKGLLLSEVASETEGELAPESNHLGLWDEKTGEVAAGKSYAASDDRGGE